jgi:uncharacterized protein (DUF1015 family)
MMTVAHPIARAWLSTSGTGAPNYDEFASDAEIIEIIAENPQSALAIEMPHLAPGHVGSSFEHALQDAILRLAEAKRAKWYEPVADLVALYRISGPGQRTAYGLWCMVDTDQISSSPDHPGLVIRNEDVFVDKVRERVALATALGHLLSPVLLLQTGSGNELQAALAKASGRAGPPAVADADAAQRLHEVWPLPSGATRDTLLKLAGAGELVVADGNHRSLAAQTAGLPRFLAVVTTPASVRIQPYHRLLRLPGVDVRGLVSRLPAPERLTELSVPDPGVVHLYSRAGAWAVRLKPEPGAEVPDTLDHALVEKVLFREALGLDADDDRIVYVGGDYPIAWLRDEVDAGRADLAVLIAPVRVADFIAVNLARRKMPRKSTWFTPKARAGLVVAELHSGTPIGSLQ